MLSIVFLIVALVLSLTLHEAAHALMSDRLGDTTARNQGRLSLNPLAHIDPFMTLALPAFLILAHSPVVFGAARPVPFNPWAVRWGRWGAALVALAGPFTNLLLAIFFAIWLRFVPGIGQSGYELLSDIITVNCAFLVFNLIPFPPLDGSRLLYAAAPKLRPVMDRIERTGLVAVFILLFVAFPLFRPAIFFAVRVLVNALVPGQTTI